MNFPHFSKTHPTLPHLSHNPARDWYLLLGILVAGIVAASLWGYWFHANINESISEELSSDEVSLKTVLDQDALAKMVAVFEVRATTLRGVRNGTVEEGSAAVDPGR